MGNQDQLRPQVQDNLSSFSGLENAEITTKTVFAFIDHTLTMDSFQFKNCTFQASTQLVTYQQFKVHFEAAQDEGRSDRWLYAIDEVTNFML